MAVFPLAPTFVIEAVARAGLFPAGRELTRYAARASVWRVVDALGVPLAVGLVVLFVGAALWRWSRRP